MENRKRNLNLHVRLTKDEIDLIRKLAKIKDITITDMLLNWAKNEYEKLEKEQIK